MKYSTRALHIAWENGRHMATLPLVVPLGKLDSANQSTTQIWVVTRQQYEISALVSQTSFGGATNGSVANLDYITGE